MTNDELINILRRYLLTDGVAQHALSLIWGQPFDGETEKITKRDTERDTETAEQKVAWLTEILVTKAGDSVFADYWLRLARRNLRLGLPLTTPEPELNPSTEESSAPQPTQPQ